MVGGRPHSSNDEAVECTNYTGRRDIDIKRLRAEVAALPGQADVPAEVFAPR